MKQHGDINLTNMGDSTSRCHKGIMGCMVYHSIIGHLNSTGSFKYDIISHNQTRCRRDDSRGTRNGSVFYKGMGLLAEYILECLIMIANLCFIALSINNKAVDIDQLGFTTRPRVQHNVNVPHTKSTIA